MSISAIYRSGNSYSIGKILEELLGESHNVSITMMSLYIMGTLMKNIKFSLFPFVNHL